MFKWLFLKIRNRPIAYIIIKFLIDCRSKCIMVNLTYTSALYCKYILYSFISLIKFLIPCRDTGVDPQPQGPKPSALPVELLPYNCHLWELTHNLSVKSRTLCQLS